MDKKTLLFIFTFTISLFFINMYFEQDHQERLRQWQEQQKVEQTKKQKVLETEIKEYKVSEKELPLAEIYSDKEGKKFLSSAISSDDALVTLSWNREIPTTVFAKTKKEQQILDSYTLTFLPQNPGEPTVYQKNGLSPLKIGDLPEFGTFYLPLISFHQDSSNASTVGLGKYVDGKFSPVSQEANPKTRQNGLLLIKTSENYLPVAYYNTSLNKLVYLEEIPGLRTVLVKAEKEVKQADKSSEKFYVIESPYQQLVFSNVGGALAEINLPFSSGEDKYSVVKEIEFDREILAKRPENALFPLRPYFTPKNGKNFEEHSKGKLGGYYPLLRRNLIQSGNKQSIKIPPRFYALNIVSEFPELAELTYDVTHFDEKSITFEAKQRHRKITKTFSLEKDEKNAPYCLNLTLKIEGDSRGLWLTSGVPEVEIISGSPAPALKYRITRNNKPAVELIDLPKEAITVTSVHPDWICNSNGFLGSILNPTDKIDPGYRAEFVPGTIVPSRLIEIDAENMRFKPQDLPGYMTLLPLKSTAGTMEFRTFFGPFADSILKTIDNTYSDPVTGYTPDYIACQTFHGWFSFISEPFAKFLFILMKFFHTITGSWAFSIILLTIALRIMMYPLNAWSSKSMIKMQKIGPEVTAIQEKYKKDPKKAQLEIMTLYRERGVNPVSGCLPMLIQMPFLIGMFDLLKSTFELRGASFIPGWIDNLTAPDVLFSWNYPTIPFIGNEFHLLPILLGVVMFLQQRLMSPLPKDSTLLTDQQRQQRAMGTMMSVLFTFMFYHFPSGLNIYWLSSMLLGILQQWWTNRKMNAITATSATKKPLKKV